LGKLFVRRLEGERLIGRIIEIEAYLGQSDPASLSSPIHVLDDGFRPKDVLVTPRIGITKAADLPLRFALSTSS
jgi:3-methyladenine DNA glycosylase Mpg